MLHNVILILIIKLLLNNQNVIFSFCHFLRPHYYYWCIDFFTFLILILIQIKKVMI